MSSIGFTSVDRIISKLQRDLGLVDINEGDIIEWIGEALGLMRVPALRQQNVAFMTVSNFETDVPDGFQSVLQIKRYNGEIKKGDAYKIPCALQEDLDKITCDAATTTTTTAAKTDCNCGKNCGDGCTCVEKNMLFSAQITKVKYCECAGTQTCGTCAADSSYRPYFDMTINYSSFTRSNFYQDNFTPVRLSDHTFFNTLVCKEIDQSPYHSSIDEYTIIGNVESKLRFSFQDGYIAIAYNKNAIDKETGYPLIPDHTETIVAIGYYVQWKMAQRLNWDNRDGSAGLMADKERLWLKYVGQATSDLTMPKTIDEYQNIVEATHYLTSRKDEYYNYFGNLGRRENRNRFRTNVINRPYGYGRY